MERFRVEVIAKTPNPQQVVYAAMHQDYSEELVVADRANWPAEAKCGEIIVKRLLAGDRGHFGPLEHPQITLNCGYFPHSVMQQVRTHRVGISFDVQCLAGNTDVTFVKSDGGGLRKIKIAELYDLWTNGEQAIRQRSIKGRHGEPPGEYRRDCKTRIRKMRLRVLNEETGLFEVGHLKDVIAKGIQPVYRLTLEDGKTLDCTANHRLFTSEGWQTMGEAVGLVTDEFNLKLHMTKKCFVMCNGIGVAGNGLYRNKQWLELKIAQGLSLKEIADLSDCSDTTVREWLKKYGLFIQPKDTQFRPGQLPWNARPDAFYHNSTWLEEQLNKGLYVDAIAELAGCSIETIKKWVYFYGLSLNKRPKGQAVPWNKGKGGYNLSLSPSSIHKRRENAKLLTKRGAESNFWKGGTSSERELIGAWTRQIAPEVHKKFNYICQCCGQRGGQLHAHHVVPVYADESLAYDFDNLVTLCKTCHEDIHQNSKEAEFAKNYNLIIEPQQWNHKPKSSRKLRAHPVKVKSVDFLGAQMTYDLEVEGPWHNFVANGMVVHNSNRYTGQRIVDAAQGNRDIEEVFYLRPVGEYTDRQGKRYDYTPEQRQRDMQWCLEAAKRYQQLITEGTSEEHARGIIPFDVRQHWVMSLNPRSLMHILDMRWKSDAQLEAQKLCELIWPHFQEWMPDVAAWYEKSRLKKARLAP
ncbi:MAG: hypothetical protein Fur0025_40540 [Oscillatoriaceae cyanobacterium]